MALDPSYFFYSDGTITLTNGSDIATGDMVSWDTAVLPFDTLYPNDGQNGVTVIKEVLSVNQIRLAKPWTGPTLAGVPYFVLRWVKHTDPKVYAIRVADYLTRLKAIPDNIEAVAAAIDADRQAVDAALALLQQIEQNVDADRQAAQQSNIDAYSAYQAAVAARDVAVAAADAAQTGVVPDNGVSTVKIQDKAVSNAKLSDMPANTIKGADATGRPKDLTPAQVRDILGEYIVRPGAIQAFPRTSAPVGWIKANGTWLSRTGYAALWAEAQASGNLAASEASKLPGQYGPGDGATSFSIPDLRGEFIRVWDDGKGTDAGRVLGSAQADDFKAHTHAASGFSAAGGAGSVNYPVTDTTLSRAARNVSTEGGTETRPRNVALLFCIKY